MPEAANLTAEDVAYWYLRLNGFLLLRNFLVHGDRGPDTRTDIDLVGARFRYRREHLKSPMVDEDWVTRRDSTIVVFCEVKKGQEDFNASWRSENRKTIESFLSIVGVISERDWESVAHQLYEEGHCEPEPHLLLTTLLIHGGPALPEPTCWKSAPRIPIFVALRFVHRRFSARGNLKRDHSQWEPSGQRLWGHFESYEKSEARFVDAVLHEIGSVRIS